SLQILQLIARYRGGGGHPHLGPGLGEDAAVDRHVMLVVLLVGVGEDARFQNHHVVEMARKERERPVHPFGRDLRNRLVELDTVRNGDGQPHAAARSRRARFSSASSMVPIMKRSLSS